MSPNFTLGARLGSYWVLRSSKKTVYKHPRRVNLRANYYLDGKRKYKLELIEKSNPDWIDLYKDLTT